MDNLKEVKMETNNIFKIIENIRSFNFAGADYTLHKYSDGEVEYNPCSDKEIIEFCNKLLAGIPEAFLVIGDIDWTKGGNCNEDELLPSFLKAVKLPDDSYYIIAKYTDDSKSHWEERITKEYIYCPNSPKGLISCNHF